MIALKIAQFFPDFSLTDFIFPDHLGKMITIALINVLKTFSDQQSNNNPMIKVWKQQLYWTNEHFLI